MRTVAACHPTQGWGNKSHKGSTKKTNSRYFVSSGYNVAYYKDDKKANRTGKFDLRKVKSIRAAEDDSLVIDVMDSGGKTVVVTFSQPSRDNWKKLWCSAVSPDLLDASLKSFHDETVNAAFVSQYGSQVLHLVAPEDGRAGKECGRGKAWSRGCTRRPAPLPPRDDASAACTRVLAGDAQGQLVHLLLLRLSAPFFHSAGAGCRVYSRAGHFARAADAGCRAAGAWGTGSICAVCGGGTGGPDSIFAECVGAGVGGPGPGCLPGQDCGPGRGCDPGQGCDPGGADFCRGALPAQGGDAGRGVGALGRRAGGGQGGQPQGLVHVCRAQPGRGRWWQRPARCTALCSLLVARPLADPAGAPPP